MINKYIFIRNPSLEKGFVLYVEKDNTGFSIPLYENPLRLCGKK